MIQHDAGPAPPAYLHHGNQQPQEMSGNFMPYYDEQRQPQHLRSPIEMPDYSRHEMFAEPYR